MMSNTKRTQRGFDMQPVWIAALLAIMALIVEPAIVLFNLPRRR